MFRETLTLANPVLLGTAAKQLGVSRVTIYYWIRCGKIDAIKFGGILFTTQAEIERILKERQPNAKK